MNKLKNILLGLTMLGSVGLAAVPAATYAQTPKDSVCKAISVNQDDASCSTSQGIDINTIIKVAINVLSTIVGVVAVIMIIVAGFKFVTAGGDSNKVTSARNTILYAIIGLIIVAMAQFIVRFVLNRIK